MCPPSTLAEAFISQGNLLVLGAGFYFYRQYSNAKAAAEKQRKAKILGQVANGEGKKSS